MNLTDILTDTIVLGFASAIGYVLKIYVKPSEAEARLISKLLLGLGMLITGFSRRWAVGHKEQLDKVRSDLRALLNRFGRTNIEG